MFCSYLQIDRCDFLYIQRTLPCVATDVPEYHSFSTGHDGVETNKVKVQCHNKCTSSGSQVSMYLAKIWVRP